MDKIDKAIDRVGAALGRLDHALAAHEPPAGAATDAVALQAERDRLDDEVRALRSRAAEDARLRTEAAGAVREALRDLRGAVADGTGERASA